MAHCSGDRGCFAGAVVVVLSGFVVSAYLLELCCGVLCR